MFRYALTPEADLRLLEPRHAEDVLALVNHNRRHLRRWLGWVDDCTTVDTARLLRQQRLDLYAQNGAFEAGIWYQGQLAGVVRVHTINWADRNTSLGYWLGREFQHRGLMTMACQAVTDHLLRSLRLKRIEIRAATENRPSRAVAERLGFAHEGTLRQVEWLYDHYEDQELYAMLRETWLDLHPDGVTCPSVSREGALSSLR